MLGRVKSWLRKLRRFGCVLATLALAGCVGPSNTPGPAAPISGTWTQLGGDGSHASWGADLPTPPLQELWYTSRAGGFEFAPIVVGGRIIIASGGVEGLDSTGATVWSYRAASGGLPFGPVAIGSTVVIPAEGGGTVSVAGVDARSGKASWPASFSAPGAQWVWAAADAHTAVVLANGSSPKLVAFDANGRLLWRTTTSADISLDKEGLTPIAVGSGLVVVETAAGLEAHDLATGRLIWSGGRVNPASTDPPFIIGDTVLAEVGENPFRLVGYSLQTGKSTINRALPGWLVRLEVSGNTIYTWALHVHGPDSLAAYSWPSLAQLWRVPMRGQNEPDNLLPFAGGILVVRGALGGSAIEFGFYGPRVARPWAWRIPHSAPNPFSDSGGETSGLVPTGGGVLLSTIDGTLFAFGP